MSRLLVVLFLFFPKVSWGHMNQMSLYVPKELFEKIQTDFAIKNFDFTPEFSDIEVSIESDKGGIQKLKVGYTQEVLDLSSYVDKIWPRFTIRFQSPWSIEGETALYFVSRYKKMELGKQQLGLGCGQALQIKSKLKSFFSKDGMDLMTKAGHYLNLLGGDYLLVQKEGQKMKMVYFRIRDGRWSHRLCAT